MGRKLCLYFNCLCVRAVFFILEGEACLPIKKTFTLFNSHLNSTRIINFLNSQRWNIWLVWFVSVIIQWSHLEPLQFILWFIAIPSATWFCTDSEVPSYWDPWVIPGYWCESQFRSWSSTSDVCDKSLQTTIFVDPSSVDKSPLIPVRLLDFLMILRWGKTYHTTTKLSQQKSEVVFSVRISVLKVVLYLWRFPKDFLSIIHSISTR